MKTLTVSVLLCSCVLYAQHQIPFASSNNTIELSIANSSLVPTSNVSVKVTKSPSWLKFTDMQFTIPQITPQETNAALFTFSVDQAAPVNTPEHIQFTITNEHGEQWTKTLLLKVSPPEKFKLHQNNPNPFNPTTSIQYQLPGVMNVSLKIYDGVGREVETLAEGMQEAGYHQHTWNASSMASGMYLYRLLLTDSNGKREFHQKKMMLVK